MKKYLDKLPREIKDLIRLAGDIAHKNNMRAYLVGGFVRDLILGLKNFDLDIAIEGEGIRFAEELAGKLKVRLIRHHRFKTATLMLERGLKIDIASARKEIYPQAASLPQVSPGSLKDDLARRDFTINAMAVSITREDFGRLIDYFSSRADLRAKRIRVLHVLSFIDDPTRILRAVRFEQRYSFRLEPNTLFWLKEAVRLKMLEKVEPQRLRDELVLDLKEENVLKELRRMGKLAGFSFISRRLKPQASAWKLLNSARQQVNWFNKNYPQRRPLDEWLIYFMGLIESMSVRDAESMCRNFALRRGEAMRIISYKKISRKSIAQLGRAGLKPSRVFSLLEPLSYEVIILLKARHSGKNFQRHIEDFFEIYNGMRILISGQDLRGLGVQPGPYYQKIFARVLKAKLEGRIKSRADELALIRKLIVKR